MLAKDGLMRPPTAGTWESVNWLGHGVHAGGVAGLTELVPVLLIQSLALGVPPQRIFQSIASGLLGRDAYALGWSSAALGAGLHVVIAIAAGVVFARMAILIPRLLRQPLLTGILFGVATFLVMTYVVVPLSAAAFPPAHNPALIAVSVLVHVFSFGWPIAFVLHHRMSTVSRSNR